jgi:hypothetical protein
MMTNRIDRLFMALHVMYGQKWTDLWKGIPIETVKTGWEHRLAHLTDQEIADGLKRLTTPFPPTLPELMTLCRPALEVPPVSDHKALDRMARQLGVSTNVDSYETLRQRIKRALAMCTNSDLPRLTT